MAVPLLTAEAELIALLHRAPRQYTGGAPRHPEM